MPRARDGLAQAEKDRELAEVRHEWACFAAQQRAKALHLHLGQEAWGHTMVKLLSELPLEVPAELIERAKFLDVYYVPTRYPDAFSEGIPAEHYGPLQSEEAIRHAGAILGFIRAQMADTG